MAQTHATDTTCSSIKQNYPNLEAFNTCGVQDLNWGSQRFRLRGRR